MAVSVFGFTQDDFKYPTKEEFLDAESRFPDITNFGFCHKSLSKLVSVERKSLKEAEKDYNLFWWDNCLLNKIGSLRFAFVNTYVNFQRNLGYNEGQDGLNGSIHESLFGFYAETTYYLIISARDFIPQIINVYLGLGVKEDRIYFDKFVSKIKSSGYNSEFISAAFDKFSEDLNDANEIRNSLTHRFPVTQKDFRAEYEGEHSSLKRGNREGYYNAQEIIDNIQFSIEALKRFIDLLKIEITPNASRL